MDALLRPDGDGGVRIPGAALTGNATQILGQMMDAIFLDVTRTRCLQRSNELLRHIPPELLPRAFRLLTRNLGTRETSNGDFMSLFMFIPEYLQRLIEIGEADAEAKIATITRAASADPNQG